MLISTSATLTATSVALTFLVAYFPPVKVPFLETVSTLMAVTTATVTQAPTVYLVPPMLQLTMVFTTLKTLAELLMLVKTISATIYTDRTSTTASLNTKTDASAAATKDTPLKMVSVTTSIKHLSRVNAPPLTTSEPARTISTVSSVVNTVSLSIVALPTTPSTLIPELTYNASTIPNLNQLNGHADMKVPTSELTPVYATLDTEQVILTVWAVHATT